MTLVTLEDSYRDIRVAKVGPAEQVHQSVEAGQLAARQLLSLHHGGVLCSVHVADGSDHPQTCTGTPSALNQSPAIHTELLQTSIPPSDAVSNIKTSPDVFARATFEGGAR